VKQPAFCEECLSTVDVQVHDARRLVAARSQRKGQHFVPSVADREPASTFDTVVSSTPDGTQTSGLGLTTAAREGALPCVIDIGAGRDLIGQTVAPFDTAVARNDLQAGFKLVERVGDDLVLELRLVARRRQRLLPVSQFTDGMKYDVRRSRHGRRERCNVADRVPRRSWIPDTDLQPRHPLGQSKEARGG